MNDITVGIPTVSRPQELNKTLKGLKSAPNKLIYLNGINKDDYIEVIKNYENEVSFIKSDQTVGIAAAWNRLIIQSDTRFVILSSDDLEYPSGWEVPLLNEINKGTSVDQVSLSWPMSFSSFCIDKKLIAKQGWFDQNFPGAYYEDEDWYLRFRERLKLYNNKSVKYEEIIPKLKTVKRPSHEKAPWNSFANTLYFFVKWKRVTDQDEKVVHSREDIPYQRRLHDPEWKSYKSIKEAYAKDDFSAKAYVFIQPHLLLRILKLLTHNFLFRKLFKISKQILLGRSYE